MVIPAFNEKKLIERARKTRERYDQIYRVLGREGIPVSVSADDLVRRLSFPGIRVR